MRAWIGIGLLAAACGGEDVPQDGGVDGVLPFCGDGVVDTDEVCDAGAANSDVAPDACRSDCLAASCGDGVVDAGEACDDGNALSGDGCDLACAVEAGPHEAEPNDVPLQATPITPGAAVAGALPDGDVDCWGVTVDENAWISARVTGPDGACPPETTLFLASPTGAVVATAYPAEPDTCVQLDPSVDDDAAYLVAGTWSLCVQGLLRAPVLAYRLTVQVGDDSCLDGAFDPAPEDDADGDGLADVCDPDDDADGVLDGDDDCPTVPDGPDAPTLSTGNDGWIRHWLIAGPFSGLSAGPAGSCQPSPDPVVGAVDDGDAVPALGEPTTAGSWRAWFGRDNAADLLKLGSTQAPREVVAVSWVYVPTAREAVLALGTDDGHTAWVNGETLGTDGTCHGVVSDAFRYPTSLVAGWNRVTVRVRDTGGGFGLKARFLDTSGLPLPASEVSLRADGPWVSQQSDLDGDGLGDVCDPEP